MNDSIIMDSTVTDKNILLNVEPKNGNLVLLQQMTILPEQ